MSDSESTESTVDLSLAAVAPVSASALRRSLVSDRMIDDAIAQAGDSGMSITGREGLMNEIIRAVLERGLSVELDDHLGTRRVIRRGGRRLPRGMGSRPKPWARRSATCPLTFCGTGNGRSARCWCPRGFSGWLVSGVMIISLYAGGMTIHDIQYHLVATLGMDLSAETISNITDSACEEVSPLEPKVRFPRNSLGRVEGSTRGQRLAVIRLFRVNRDDRCTQFVNGVAHRVLDDSLVPVLSEGCSKSPGSCPMISATTLARYSAVNVRRTGRADGSTTSSEGPKKPSSTPITGAALLLVTKLSPVTAQ